MQSIFESQSNMKYVSNDFEIIGDSYKSRLAREFLKELKSRQIELGLTYDQCRQAALKIKKGDFEDGLKLIWGHKVKVEKLNSIDGYVSTKTYTIDGYGEFTESVVRDFKGYQYSIIANYKKIEYPAGALKHIVYILLKNNLLNMSVQEENAVKQAFLNKPCAEIYNFLFVCADGYDMDSVLNKFHLKLKNKLG